MVDLKETLDILRNLKSLKWRQTSYDMEEENIKNPRYGMSFGRTMLCPICLIAIYIVGRLFGGNFLDCILLVIIAAVVWGVWRVLSKFIHLRKPSVNQQLDELFYKRKKTQRQINRLNSKLMESVVPSEYLNISSVEQLIYYIDSGQARSLREAILLLDMETRLQQTDDQNERIEQLERELKEAKRQASAAQKAADAAQSRATSAELRSLLKK